MQNILVTGGLGYIGSHTVVELIAADYRPIIVDNLANSKISVLERLEKITDSKIDFEQVDLCDRPGLAKVFEKYPIDGVIHFAGLKAVGESVAKPLLYYHTNIDSTLNLLEIMNQNDVKKLIFSSSATVYGEPEELPLKETSRTGLGLTNPYGQTKYMIEQILRDLAASDKAWEITALRYFNPIGAHSSGQIGEDPKDTPNNLLPYISKVAAGELPSLSVFGDDYDTPDGTGVRDYIHVVDLADGHLAALKNLKNGFEVYNLGTGQGTSVLELLSAFEEASNQKIAYEIKPRRAGDIATCYADVSKANSKLGWKTQKSIAEACADSWRWQVYANENLN